MTPNDAVLARTSLASARAASLLTFPRLARGHLTTVVTVAARADGSAEVLLDRDSAALRQITARPLAVLRVAPSWCEPLTLHGAVCRLPGVDRGGRVRLVLEAAAVRVGQPGRVVDADHYAAAQPDPLHEDAPAVLSHLNAGHGDALTACLRARGRQVGFVEATGLHADGLTVLAVCTDGTELVRLPFPRPVARLADLPAGLAAVLTARCGCHCRH